MVTLVRRFRPQICIFIQVSHSNAKNGTVKLERSNGMLQIVVFDNGIGFNVDSQNVDAGIGLSQIRARVEVLKCFINITSSKKGTSISISAPIFY